MRFGFVLGWLPPAGQPERKRRAVRDPYAELSERNALTSMYFICDENAPRADTRAALPVVRTTALRLHWKPSAFSRLVPTRNLALAGEFYKMIDDIAEGVVKGIIRTILEFLFRVVVEVILFYSGEILIFFLTLGQRRPRWDYYADEKASKFIIFTELSVWIGVAFWLFIAWLIINGLQNSPNLDL